MKKEHSKATAIDRMSMAPSRKYIRFHFFKNGISLRLINELINSILNNNHFAKVMQKYNKM
jgi:hypothetical protein